MQLLVASKFEVIKRKNWNVITMKQFIFATARNLGKHPVPVTIGSFGVFLTVFAAFDYNRERTFQNSRKKTLNTLVNRWSSFIPGLSVKQ